MATAQSFLKRIPQYTRAARHIRSVVGHGTARKWANLARVEMERKLRRVEVKGRPYLLIIDPCNYCNLRCPLCPTGMGELGRAQSMMSFDCFQRYFDPHAPYLFEVYLHNWGESLMNKDIFRMIEYAQARNVGTNLSSNMVAPTSTHLDGILDAGLEYLVVSLDGVDQQSYGKYRVRGNFERVIENMSELIRRRNQRNKKTPMVEWQYIVMRHNEDRVEEAEKLAKSIGVDLLRFIPVGLPYEAENRDDLAKEWFPLTMNGAKDTGDHDQQFGQTGRPGPCFYLYRSMVVNADGGVSPCCIVYRRDRDFADLAEGFSDIGDVWNNDRYRSARSLFSAESVPDRPRTVCDTCNLFEWHKSKAGEIVPVAKPPQDASCGSTAAAMVARMAVAERQEEASTFTSAERRAGSGAGEAAALRATKLIEPTETN